MRNSIIRFFLVKGYDGPVFLRGFTVIYHYSACLCLVFNVSFRNEPRLIAMYYTRDYLAQSDSQYFGIYLVVRV